MTARVLQPTTAITQSGLLPSTELVVIIQSQAQAIGALERVAAIHTQSIEATLSALEAAADRIEALEARVAALEAP